MAHETFSNSYRNAAAMNFAYLIFEGQSWKENPGTGKMVCPKTGAALEPGDG